MFILTFVFWIPCSNVQWMKVFRLHGTWGDQREFPLVRCFIRRLGTPAQTHVSQRAKLAIYRKLLLWKRKYKQQKLGAVSQLKVPPSAPAQFLIIILNHYCWLWAPHSYEGACGWWCCRKWHGIISQLYLGSLSRGPPIGLQGVWYVLQAHDIPFSENAGTGHAVLNNVSASAWASIITAEEEIRGQKFLTDGREDWLLL